jgi:pimeloyl-ACP methyl ester carboxylesterase
MTATTRSSATASDGTTLSYREHGSAGLPTMVVLHSLGADGHMWDGCLPHLTGTHRVVVPDCRGHGSSGVSSKVSIDQWVDDLHDVFESAGAAPAVLVGVSLGGIQAIAFAAEHPELVSALVVADTFVALPTDVADSKIRNLGGQAAVLPMSAVAEQYVADTFQEPYPDGADAVRRALSQMDADSYVAAVDACFGVQIADRLAHVSAPTLVLWGDRDAKTPRPLNEEIAAGIDGSRFAVVPDAGHLSNIDNPAAFSAAVAAFSLEHGRRPAPRRGEGGSSS